MEAVDNFFQRWNGKSLDVDGFPEAQRYQCVDVFHKYNEEVLGVGYISANPIGGAIDYYDNFSGLGLGQWYERIANDMSNPNQLPQKGDVMVWGTRMGTYGHIAIMQSAGSGTFTSFDQNYGGRFCHFQSHSWSDGALGWLRPKKFINTSPAIEPNQRVVSNPDGVNHRAAPSTSATVLREWQKGEVLTFKGYVHGESVSGNDIWYVGYYSGGYLWSGSFENPTTDRLPDLTAPAPTPAPTPTPPPYTFAKDLTCVTEVIPAALGNFEYGNFPAQPQKIVLHDFGTKGVDTIQSLINTFTKAGTEVSSHFAVSGTRIIQLVSLKDRAYHATAAGNGFIGIELDPGQDADTIASGRKLLQELKDKGYTTVYIKHSSIVATSCGDDISLNNYDLTPPPTPEEPSDTDKENNGLLKQILALLQGFIAKFNSIFK